MKIIIMIYIIKVSLRIAISSQLNVTLQESSSKNIKPSSVYIAVKRVF